MLAFPSICSGISRHDKYSVAARLLNNHSPMSYNLILVELYRKYKTINNVFPDVKRLPDDMVC